MAYVASPRGQKTRFSRDSLDLDCMLEESQITRIPETLDLEMIEDSQILTEDDDTISLYQDYIRNCPPSQRPAKILPEGIPRL